MPHKRNTEIQKKHRHSQRLSRGYEINGQWYFELRGGGQKGPYDTELLMRAEINEFIQLHELMNQIY